MSGIFMSIISVKFVKHFIECISTASPTGD